MSGEVVEEANNWQSVREEYQPALDLSFPGLTPSPKGSKAFFPEDCTLEELVASSPPFHGFGPETTIPDKLEIINLESSPKMICKKRTGRPRGSKSVSLLASLSKEQVVQSKRYTTSSLSASSPASAVKPLVSLSSSATMTSSPRIGNSGTMKRPNIYLIDQPPLCSLPMSKLPRTGQIMRLLFHNLISDPKISNHSNPLTIATKTAVKLAATTTLSQVKQVWLHHFGLRLIQGQDYVSDQVDREKIMIQRDDNIVQKFMALYCRWRSLEQLSRKPNRKAELLRKATTFKGDMEEPMNLLKRDGEVILCQAGIKAWEEDLTHLRQQLQRQQIGTCDGHDQRQAKKDNRSNYEKHLKEVKIAKECKKKEEEEVKAKENEESNCEGSFEDLKDEDFEGPKVKKAKKVDIMTHISRTADGRGLSYRDRTAMAGSLCNAVGIDIKTTNVSTGTAFRKAHSERIRISQEVKENFTCPEYVSVRFDGKTLTLKGKMKSTRIAVYISGVDADNVRKLLGIPETP